MIIRDIRLSSTREPKAGDIVFGDVTLTPYLKLANGEFVNLKTFTLHPTCLCHKDSFVKSENVELIIKGEK